MKLTSAGNVTSNIHQQNLDTEAKQQTSVTLSANNVVKYIVSLFVNRSNTMQRYCNNKTMSALSAAYMQKRVATN